MFFDLKQNQFLESLHDAQSQSHNGDEPQSSGCQHSIFRRIGDQLVAISDPGLTPPQKIWGSLFSSFGVLGILGVLGGLCFQDTPIKHWEKLACTLSKFVASLPYCRDCKNRDFKIMFVELFYVVCFQWFELVSQKKLSIIFSLT